MNYDKYRKAVDAAKDVLRKIAKSPPPHRPPFEIISQLPDVLKPVFEVVKSEFPNPLLPVTFINGILTNAIKEIKEMKGLPSQDKDGT